MDATWHTRRMNEAQYIAETRQRLAGDGSVVSDETLPSGAVLVGYQSQFKIKWGATKLHLFTIVAAVPEATAGGFDLLVRESLAYAKREKGQLRGLQTGVAVIPALVGATAHPNARAAAEGRPPKEFAAMALPAIVDLAAGQVYSYQGKILIGAIYAGFLRERLQTTLPAPHPGA